VRALKLADGQSISLTDRTVSRELRESVLHSVCARFSTVLGPGSDWYHEDHIHLDLMERHNNYKICQWDVWDPLPRVAPLLPAERPDQAPPREVAAKSNAAKSEAAKSGAREIRDCQIRYGRAGRRRERAANEKAPAKPALLTRLIIGHRADEYRLLYHRAAAARLVKPSASERRVAVLGLQHHDDRAHLHPVVQIDHVPLVHPDTAGGDRRADIFRLVGAVNPEQRCPCRPNRDRARANPSDCQVPAPRMSERRAARFRPWSDARAAIRVMLPILAMPDHAIASSPTVMP